MLLKIKQMVSNQVSYEQHYFTRCNKCTRITNTKSFLRIDSQSDDDVIALYRIVYAYSYVIYPEGGGK